MEAYYEYVNVLARVSAWRCFQIMLDPEDLAQEAMLRVREKWSQLKSSDPTGVKAWLKSVVHSVLNDLIDRAYAGKRDRRKEVPMDEILDDTSARLGAFLPPNNSTPSKAAVRNERFLAVAQALGKLPDDQKIAVELHHFSGLTLEQVAQRMDKSIASVAGLIRRGLKALRGSLGELE